MSAYSMISTLCWYYEVHMQCFIENLVWTRILEMVRFILGHSQWEDEISTILSATFKPPKLQHITNWKNEKQRKWWTVVPSRKCG